jgi:tetratricopeptide (TPR) repeat protein
MSEAEKKGLADPGPWSRLLDAKTPEEALAHLERAMAMDSMYVKDANFQLGFLFFARRDYPSAMPFFQAAIKADSTFVPGLLNLGLCQLQNKDQSGAIETLRRVVVLNPSENRARIWIGQTLAAMDSLPEAFEMYQSAMAQDSTNADAYRGAGLVLLLQKNCADAEGYLEKATQLDPENLPGHIWLGQVFDRHRVPRQDRVNATDTPDEPSASK